MLDLFRRFWTHYTASLPKSEVVDSVPESQWGRGDLLPPVSASQRKAFNDLLALVHAHLPPEEAAACIERGAAAFVRADEADVALWQALLPDEADEPPQRRGFIGCDWKAVDEVQWHADGLCRVHGIAGRWVVPPQADTGAAFKALDAWLQPQGYRLLLDMDAGDSWRGFVLRQAQVPAALRLARRLKIDLGHPRAD